ncbi:3705_t:CDS:10, partial [Gigaspora margarita]
MILEVEWDGTGIKNNEKVITKLHGCTPDGNLSFRRDKKKHKFSDRNTTYELAVHKKKVSVQCLLEFTETESYSLEEVTIAIKLPYLKIAELQHKEIILKQEDNSSIKLDDSVCNEIGTHKDDIIIIIKKKTTNTKLQSPEFSTKGIYLGIHYMRSPNHANNQRWTLTLEGHIVLKHNSKFVIEVLYNEITIKDGLNLKISRMVQTPNFISFIRRNISDLKNVDSSVKGKAYVRDCDGKNELLGHCYFEVTRDLIKEVIDIRGSDSYRAKFFYLEPFPQPTSDFLENIKDKPFKFINLIRYCHFTSTQMNHQENYSIYINLNIVFWKLTKQYGSP